MQEKRKQAAGQRAVFAAARAVADKEMRRAARQLEMRGDDPAECARRKERFFAGKKQHACLFVALAACEAAEPAAVGQKGREIGKGGAGAENGGKR